MTDDRDPLPAGTIEALRAAGARFALLHGSRAAGTHRPDSDVDVAAWWASDAPPSFEVDVPAGSWRAFVVVDQARADAVRVLGRHGVLPAELAERLSRAVGFRNVLVHDYIDVDDQVVLARLDDPSDLTAFAKAVSEWMSPGR